MGVFYEWMSELEHHAIPDDNREVADSVHEIAFYQGLELNFVFGALTCSSAIPTRLLGLALHVRDYNLSRGQ